MSKTSKPTGIFAAKRTYFLERASELAMIAHGACMARTPRQRYDFHYYDDGSKVPVNARGEIVTRPGDVLRVGLA